MLTLTSCKNSVRGKRWIQHQRFFSVALCLLLKACALGVNKVADGYDVIKKRGAAIDGQPRRSTTS